MIGPVVAFVSPSSSRRLLTAFPHLRLVETWEQLEAVVSRCAPAAVLIDGCAAAQSATELRKLQDDHAGVGMVLYTPLEPQALRESLGAMRAGVNEIAFAGYDDSRDRLTQIIESAIAKARALQLADALSSLFDRLPPGLRSAAEAMFRSPTQFQTVTDLACAARMSNRNLFRSLKRCGIRSGRRLIAAARIAAAYHMLTSTRRSAQEVAAQLGYASVEQLSAHFAELANCTCRDVQRGIPLGVFCGAVLTSLTTKSIATPEFAELA